MRLSEDRFEKARGFVETHGRELDRRLFDFYFERGSVGSVLAELENYQNVDGGFGRAIEPDFRLEASSPMATSVGLQYCVDVGAGAENPVVASTIDYLLSVYDGEGGYWPATFLDVNDEPHAPWWHLDEVKPPHEAAWPNPSAELIGYLHGYSAHVPPSFLEGVTERLEKNLRSSETIHGFYNILCYQRAAVHLPEPLKNEVDDRIRGAYVKLAPLTLEELGEIRVYWLAPSPDSILAQTFHDNVVELMDLEMDRQAEDGGWWPTWRWGQYEDAWRVAEKEWAGKMTVEFLHSLRNYGKLEGFSRRSSGSR